MGLGVQLAMSDVLTRQSVLKARFGSGKRTESKVGTDLGHVIELTLIHIGAVEGIPGKQIGATSSIGG